MFWSLCHLVFISSEDCRNVSQKGIFFILERKKKKDLEIKSASKSLFWVNSRSATRTQNYLLLDSDRARGWLNREKTSVTIISNFINRAILPYVLSQSLVQNCLRSCPSRSFALFGHPAVDTVNFQLRSLLPKIVQRWIWMQS